ncbi:MAG: chromate transporter [Spirochaetia bacterium]|jgi:chromate transporter|nr:chromate transporter [Spirochaetia bacterium]
MIYLELFFNFFRIGLFAIGGGLATLPFLFELSANNPTWLSAGDISNMVAVSQSTPGPMGINMATFAGHQAAGLLGSLVATFGLVTPSVIIILLVARALERFRDNKFVNYAFYGLRATVIALIGYACSQVFVLAILDGNRVRPIEAGMFAVMLFLIVKFKKVHPIIWIAIAAVLGIVLKLPS